MSFANCSKASQAASTKAHMYTAIGRQMINDGLLKYHGKPFLLVENVNGFVARVQIDSFLRDTELQYVIEVSVFPNDKARIQLLPFPDVEAMPDQDTQKVFNSLDLSFLMGSVRDYFFKLGTGRLSFSVDWRCKTSISIYD